jgi:hypothetical protein
MKESRFSKEELLVLFTHREGTLYWNHDRSNKVKQGDIAGTLTSVGYNRVTINKEHYAAHRLIWVIHNGSIPVGFVVDHINGIRNDDRIENLRLATLSQNQQNRKFSKTELGKGVSYEKARKKYRAQIMIAQKSTLIGRFNTAEEAHTAYCEAASLLFGEFANNGGIK